MTRESPLSQLARTGSGWARGLNLWHRHWFWIVATLILLGGAILRLVGISNHLVVGDDQARDILFIKHSLEAHRPMVVGPVLSPNDLPLYLGPFFYYLILPAVVLGRYHPLGPALMVAFLSIASIYLLINLGRKAFSPRVGLLAGLLFAFSAPVILRATFAWNPNVIPIVSIGIIEAFWAWSRGKVWGFPWLLIFLAIATQLHSTTFLYGVAILMAISLVRPPRPSRSQWVSGGMGVFLIYLPVIYHEIKHHGLILRSYGQLLFEQRSTFSISLWNQLLDARNVLVHFYLNDLLSHRHSLPFTYLGLALLVIGFVQFRKQPVAVVSFSILLWGWLGIMFYNETIFAHYFNFLFVPTILGLAFGLDWLSQWGWPGKASVAAFLAVFLWFNIPAAVAHWHYLGREDYPAQAAPDVIYKDVQQSVHWILRHNRDVVPEVLFVKPSAGSNQLAFDLEIERSHRVPIERDGVLVIDQPANGDYFQYDQRWLSSHRPKIAHLNPLYIIVEPAATSLPPEYTELPLVGSRKFGQVRVYLVDQTDPVNDASPSERSILPLPTN